MALTDRGVGTRRDGTVWLNVNGVGPRAFTERIIRTPSTELQQTRRYFGTSITPQVIEMVLRAADFGHLRDLTDLEYETVGMDPHLACELGKRVRALGAAKLEVKPANGAGVDEKQAAFWADVVRQQLMWLPNFRQSLQRLNYAHAHGRAALEKMWAPNPAGSKVKWRIDSLNWIHPRRLSLGPEREFRVRDDIWSGLGFEARGLELRAFPFKFIQFGPQLFNDYIEREGFLPRALFWSFFKRFSKREQLVLLEVFGKPWRIMEAVDQANIQYDEMKEAAHFIDEMGGQATGVAPPGTKVTTTQPEKGAGEVHKDVIYDSNEHISKLILGQTRTTEAQPGALGSDGDRVAQSEQDRIYAEDAANISDILTEQLGGDIVVLNGGPEQLANAPRIELTFEQPPNRTEEISNTKQAVQVGVPLAESEVYERLGFRKPNPGERVVQAPPAAGLGGGGGGPARVGLMPQGSDDEGGESPGGGASPLGEGGESVPSTELNRLQGDDLALARASRVLALLEHASRNPSEE